MKIGLVLSGGGSRGFAHLGVIKALTEAGIKPDIISGASAGALVGSFICAGYSTEFIADLIQKKGIFGNLKLALNKFGIFSLEKVEKLIHEYIPHNSFENLQTKLIVCATDIKRGEPKYFDQNELAKPVLASCAIPGIFSPIKIDGHTYIDGGVINNLPLEPIEDQCEFLIGVNVMPVEKTMPVSSVKDIMMKCLLLSIGEQSAQKLKRFNMVIEPKGIGKFGGLQLKNATEIFDLGYQSAKAIISQSLEKQL
jgi:NTE family protein